MDDPTMTGVVDRKLAHLVKKMMNPNDSSPPNTDYVVTILRTQHREYQRKNASDLKKQVEVAVEYLLSMQDKQQQTSPMMPAQQRSSASPSLSKKRRSAIMEATDDGKLTNKVVIEDEPVREPLSSKKRRERTEEKSYDKAAVQEEVVRERVGAGGGLNASLRNRYRKQQQKDSREERVIDLVSKVDKEDDEEDSTQEKPSATNATDPTASISKVKKRKRAKGTPGLDRLKMQDNDSPSFLQPVPRPKERYTDLGGMDATVRELRQLVEYPIMRPELYHHLGIEPPRGVLLRGPPGTGKSHLANAIAGELDVDFFRVSAPELVSGMSGESEGRIRDLFKSASDHAPAIIFLDEIDAVAPKRNEAGSSRGMEKRMVAQLLTSMDAIAPEHNRDRATVVVLAATNRPDSLDSALRRAGRFDREILLGVPDEEAREKIVRSMAAGMRLSGDFDFPLIAKKTPGFVGADLRSLLKEAAVLAINRIYQNIQQIDGRDDEKKGQGDPDSKPKPLTAEEMEPLYVTMTDFLCAIPSVQPSSKREGFATVPDVSWDDIGALQDIREELAISVLEPIRNPEKFKLLGLTIHAGVLLYGPPGCGKTLLAKAIANESGANFISVKGPELLDKYVGESERSVRLVFERARASSPCVVFFDELDSLVPKRGMDSSGSGVSERVVNQLLTELDGLDSRRSVFVIAATNRPELIDPAMMRPGRLDKLLYVPVPSPEERVSILKALTKTVKLASDVDLDKIGSSDRATGYSGADCAALLREAGLAVLKEDASRPTGKDCSADKEPLCIQSKHFDAAFKAVIPSVSIKDQKRYDRMRERMSTARSPAVAENDTNNGDNETATGDDTNMNKSGMDVEETSRVGHVDSAATKEEATNDNEAGEKIPDAKPSTDTSIVKTEATEEAPSPKKK